MPHREYPDYFRDTCARAFFQTLFGSIRANRCLVIKMDLQTNTRGREGVMELHFFQDGWAFFVENVKHKEEVYDIRSSIHLSGCPFTDARVKNEFTRVKPRYTFYPLSK